MDSNLYGNVDPYVLGAAAVAESVRNVIAVGAVPLAISDCLIYGPRATVGFMIFKKAFVLEKRLEPYHYMMKIFQLFLGMLVFTMNREKLVTLWFRHQLFAVLDVRTMLNARTMQASTSGLTLLLVGKRYNEFGATQLATVFTDDINTDQAAPQVRLTEEAAHNRFVRSLYEQDFAEVCHDITGGLWQSVCEMVLGERASYRVGASLQLPLDFSVASSLFSEKCGYVVAIDPANVPKALEDAESQDVYCDDWSDHG